MVSPLVPCILGTLSIPPITTPTQFPPKIFEYGIAGSLVTAVLSALPGLSIWAKQPKKLPFGFNPENVMQTLLSVAIGGFGYAFIGIMSHMHFQDNPFIMWPATVVPSAIISIVLSCIGKK